MHKKLGWISALALAASGISVASAQEVDTSDGEAQDSKKLDTIVITATKREQTLQDVPVAVSVVGGDDILRAQIVDAFDLQSIVPSLRVSQLERSANTTFIIRGFGNGGNNIGVEPSVAVFIDGVFRTRSSGSLSDLPDVERVEVLRGPQSTLFGKNASAGVVSIVTQKPSYEWGAKVEGTFGRYNQRIGKFHFTGPIADDVAAFSLAGSINQRDGYVDNLANGDDLNDRDRWTLRGQLLFEPNDDLSIRLIGDMDEIDEKCCYAPNFQNGPTGAVIEALGGQVPDNPYAYQTFLNFTPTNTVENSGFSGEVNWETGIGTLTSVSSIRNQESSSNGDVDFTSAPLIGQNNNRWEIDTFTQELRLSGGTDNIDWLVGGFYYNEDLKATSDVTFDVGFNPYANIASGGFTGLVEGLLGVGTFFEAGTGTFETFTQDNESFNIFSQVDYSPIEKLTLTAGLGYVVDEKTVTGSAVNTDLFASLDFESIFSNPAIITPDVLRGLDLPTLSGGEVPAQFDDLVFGSLFGAIVMQEPTPANIGAWQAALATGDPIAAAQFAAIQANTPAAVDQTAAQLRAGLAPLVAGELAPLQFLPGFVNFPNAVEDGKTEDDKITYTLRAAYDVSDNINLYASYSTGYKASSWNITRDSSYFARQAGQLNALGLIPPNRAAGTRYAGPEEVVLIEFGAKAEWDRAAVNIAVFEQTIEGFQSVIFQGTGFVLANAGEQKATGIEIDATVSPIDQLTLGFSGLFLDPEYVEFENAPGVGGPTDLSGATPAGIHTTSLSFSAQYEEELATGILGYIRADYQYEDEIQVVDNVPEDVLSREVNMLNASLGAVWDSGFEISFWGRNLTNDEFTQSGFPTTAQSGSFNGYPNTPATYGMTLRKSW